MRRRSYVVAVATGVLWLLPAVAFAHGLGSQDPDRPVGEYIWLGAEHLLAGWDHLLFILGIVLLAGSLWRATKLISLFVLGHSVTLMLSTTQEWTVSTTMVDIVIALSLVFVAAVWRFSGDRIKDRWFGAALLAIGLVHGLGLGTRLLELGVSDDDLAWRILAFNLGVELGQAVAVVAFSGALYALARWAPAVRRGAPEPAFVCIAAAGIIGTTVIAVQSGDDAGRTQVSESPTTTESDSATCVEEPLASPPPLNNAGHPEKRFYDRTETVPQANFDHVVGDGYVIVRYRPDITDVEVAELRQAVEGEDKAVIAGPDPAQTEPLIATVAYRRLICTKVDIPALLAFRDAWFTEIYGSAQPTA